jgi:hypothetical protein
MPMDAQRILFIGMPVKTIPVRTAKFFETFNITDIELIAWNAETLVTETQEKTGQSFHSYHHPFVYSQFKELYEKKMVQILQWIRHGQVLVIFPYLFSDKMKTDGTSGDVAVDINQFPPFNLISVEHVSEDSVEVLDDFANLLYNFAGILKCDMVLTGEDIVPLFQTSRSRQDSSTIAGAVFRVGRGAIVFSPPPKNWGNPKLLKYLEALAKLPDMLNQTVDPLPEGTSVLQWPALWLAALAALIVGMTALTPFWGPQVERLLPWGAKSPAAGQDYAALAARLTELEKRRGLSSLDVDAMKSAASALTRRVDQLEAALSHPQESPAAQPSNAPVAPTPPAASPNLSNRQATAPAPAAAIPHLSTEEITELLTRGDTLLRSGDVVSARLFYERAANAGDGRAALRLGATFDPAFLGQDVLRGVRGDPTEALLWYRRSRDLGEPEAERRLKSFNTE